MCDPYGDLKVAQSISSMGNRYVCVYYLTRPATTGNAEDRLELGIIQTELDLTPGENLNFTEYHLQSRQW